jgi:hypothetical protein
MSAIAVYNSGKVELLVTPILQYCKKCFLAKNAASKAVLNSKKIRFFAVNINPNIHQDVQ